MYKYFIAYIHISQSKGSITWGTGNTETHYYKEIESIEDIRNISRSIEKDRCLEENSVSIINFIKLN